MTPNNVERYTLAPNVWQEVSEAVYQDLRSKFGQVGERYVLDAKTNERNPHEAGEMPAMIKERKPTRVIEGLEDE